MKPSKKPAKTKTMHCHCIDGGHSFFRRVPAYWKPAIACITHCKICRRFTEQEMKDLRQ